MESRNLRLSLVKSILVLLSLLILMTVIHEGSHYLAALALGVPLESFTWFDSSYLAPVLVPSTTEFTTGTTIVGYAGGLVSGALLLSAFVLQRDWLKQSIYRWLVGFYIVTFGFWQICQGILEGAFHGAYVTDASMFWGPTYLIGYAAALLGMAVYWCRFPLRVNKSPAAAEAGVSVR